MALEDDLNLTTVTFATPIEPDPQTPAYWRALVNGPWRVSTTPALIDLTNTVAVSGTLDTDPPGDMISPITQRFTSSDGNFRRTSVFGPGGVPDDDEVWGPWMKNTGGLAGDDRLLASKDATTFGANLIGDPDFNDIFKAYLPDGTVDPNGHGYWAIYDTSDSSEVSTSPTDCVDLTASRFVKINTVLAGAPDARNSEIRSQNIPAYESNRYKLTVKVLIEHGYAGQIQYGFLIKGADGSIIDYISIILDTFDGSQLRQVKSYENYVASPSGTRFIDLSLYVNWGGSSFGDSVGYVGFAVPRLLDAITASGLVTRSPSGIGAAAGQTTITMQEPVPTERAWTVEVVVNGVLQDAGVDYTTDGSTTLTLAFAMNAGDTYRARHVHAY